MPGGLESSGNQASISAPASSRRPIALDSPRRQQSSTPSPAPFLQPRWQDVYVDPIFDLLAGELTAEPAAGGGAGADRGEQGVALHDDAAEDDAI